MGLIVVDSSGGLHGDQAPQGVITVGDRFSGEASGSKAHRCDASDPRLDAQLASCHSGSPDRRRLSWTRIPSLPHTESHSNSIPLFASRITCFSHIPIDYTIWDN